MERGEGGQGARQGGRGTGDTRLASVHEGREVGYHGALWLGDFTASPSEGGFIMHTGGGEGKQRGKEGSEATWLRFDIITTR